VTNYDDRRSNINNCESADDETLEIVVHDTDDGPVLTMAWAEVLKSAPTSALIEVLKQRAPGIFTSMVTKDVYIVDRDPPGDR